MSNRYRRYYHRRRTTRTPKAFWISLAVLVAFGISATVLLIDPAVVGQTSMGSLWQGAIALGRKTASRTGLAAHPERLIYPYSIIAGGVHNKAEFEDAMKTDPVAAAHYANFNASKFRLVKLQHPEYAYVSFRVGDNVYWTSHRVELREGETLISDGSNLGRTRCGNRVSQAPRLPTYDHEPSAKELNTPTRPKVETEAFSAVNPLAPGGVIPAPGALLAPGGPSSPPLTANIGGMPPLIPNLPEGCPAGTTTDSKGNCITSNVPVPPPVSPTPENNSWVLFLTGGLVLAGYGLMRRRSEALR
ncbi:MAG: hypothetical protein ACRD1I_04530 [Terriglobia bacterium]